MNEQALKDFLNKTFFMLRISKGPTVMQMHTTECNGADNGVTPMPVLSRGLS